jgi:uncharacterized RDD family membrane protein YckC
MAITASRRHRGSPGARLALRRVLAWCVDWLILSAYAAALVPVGLLLNRSVHMASIGWNALSFTILVVPATVWLAAWEAAPRAATPGKRALKLQVRHDDGPPGWWRSLARTALKVALPWELGHTAAFVLSTASTSMAAQVLGMVCGVLACVLALTYLVALFVRSGRTPYDRATGTAVRTRREPS